MAAGIGREWLSKAGLAAQELSLGSSWLSELWLSLGSAAHEQWQHSPGST